MKWARRIGAAVVAAASLWFFFSEAFRHREEIAALHWTAALGFGCVTAVGVQVLAALADAWAWGFLLVALGEPARRREAVSVFAVSQFAKYLPGNVAQHVGRVFMAQERGWKTTPVVISLVVENVTALAAGGLLIAATASLWVVPSGLRYSPLALALLAVAALVLIRALLTHPPSILMRRFTDFEPSRPSFFVLGLYLAVHSLSFVAMGTAVATLLRGTAGVWPDDLWLLPGIVALAWLAGYLVPGAPAGLGVREAILTATLGPTLGVPVVVSAAIIFRVTSLAADVAVLCAGLLLRTPKERVPGVRA